MEEQTIEYVFKLLDIPWWCILVAVLLGVVAWRVWKKPSLGVLVGYSVLLLAETVLLRKQFVGEHLRLELFWSWRQWNVQRDQILANIVMFIPVGMLSSKVWYWNGIWFAASLSVLIEGLQLITVRGLCEFDDLIHNCLGAAVGAMFISFIFGKRKEERK